MARNNAGTMLRLLLLVTLTAAAFAADISKPIASLRLPDGRILKNALITVYRSDEVIVKHVGGSAIVRYEFLPDDVRSEAEKKRPGGPRFFPGDTALSKTAVSGQVFITTRGQGAYKFSNVDVYAFPMEVFEVWKHTNINPVNLPKPLARATTDADGKFSLNVPSGMPFFLFAQAGRLMSDGTSDRHEWRAPSSEIKKLDAVVLSTEWRYSQRPVKIEETP